MESLYVAQVSLEPLGSKDPLASASQVRITDVHTMASRANLSWFFYHSFQTHRLSLVHTLSAATQFLLRRLFLLWFWDWVEQSPGWGQPFYVAEGGLELWPLTSHSDPLPPALEPRARGLPLFTTKLGLPFDSKGLGLVSNLLPSCHPSQFMVSICLFGWNNEFIGILTGEGLRTGAGQERGRLRFTCIIESPSSMGDDSHTLQPRSSLQGARPKVTLLDCF